MSCSGRANAKDNFWKAVLGKLSIILDNLGGIAFQTLSKLVTLEFKSSMSLYPGYTM